MMKLGLALPFTAAFSLPQYLALVAQAEAAGYDTLWTGEVATEGVTTMAVLASHTTRVNIASGILPVQTRTPTLLGMTAASLGHMAPGRIRLGLGVSSPIIVGQWNGLPYDRPLEQLREAVTIIRTILAGERVNFEGKFYRIKNFRMAQPPPPRPVPIYLGALGPRMLQLAGEIADGVLLNWIPPEAVPRSISHIETGAKRAGRNVADLEIAAFIRTLVTDDPAPARAWLARDITGYVIVDSYARFFTGCGFDAEVEAVNNAWKAGDRAGAVRQISERFLDGLGVVGPPEFCRQRLREFAAAGLTQPVVIPFSPDSDPNAPVTRTLQAV
ncbi:MAG: LLM class F420-dependent oxidoreductase, partial [Candidatus Rokubacteria bacterium]|nr:LLM class F420-dependent oxidoreductase [Candidatus Rokubacteria bacterium]